MKRRNKLFCLFAAGFGLTGVASSAPVVTISLQVMTSTGSVVSPGAGGVYTLAANTDYKIWVGEAITDPNLTGSYYTDTSLNGLPLGTQQVAWNMESSTAGVFYPIVKSGKNAVKTTDFPTDWSLTQPVISLNSSGKDKATGTIAANSGAPTGPFYLLKDGTPEPFQFGALGTAKGIVTSWFHTTSTSGTTVLTLSSPGATSQTVYRDVGSPGANEGLLTSDFVSPSNFVTSGATLTIQIGSSNDSALAYTAGSTSFRMMLGNTTSTIPGVSINNNGATNSGTAHFGTAVAGLVLPGDQTISAGGTLPIGITLANNVSGAGATGPKNYTVVFTNTDNGSDTRAPKSIDVSGSVVGNRAISIPTPPTINSRVMVNSFFDVFLSAPGADLSNTKPTLSVPGGTIVSGATVTATGGEFNETNGGQSARLTFNAPGNAAGTVDFRDYISPEAGVTGTQNVNNGSAINYAFSTTVVEKRTFAGSSPDVVLSQHYLVGAVAGGNASVSSTNSGYVTDPTIKQQGVSGLGVGPAGGAGTANYSVPVSGQFLSYATTLTTTVSAPVTMVVTAEGLDGEGTYGNIGTNIVATGVGVAEALSGSRTSFGGALIADIASGGSYAGLASKTLASGTVLGTEAKILGGVTASGSTQVQMKWRQRFNDASIPETSLLYSDVVDLSGIALNGGGSKHGSQQTDQFVLQMTAQDHGTVPYWMVYLDLGADGAVGGTGPNADSWQPAVAGNFGGKLFDDPNAFHSNTEWTPGGGFTLGDYGYYQNQSDGKWYAWAVLDHNSQFAVVPEPTPILLGLGLLGILRMRRRHQPKQA